LETKERRIMKVYATAADEGWEREFPEAKALET